MTRLFYYHVFLILAVKTFHLLHIKLFFTVLKKAFLLFRKNDPLRLAGATAFFANFALPIILLLLVRIFGLFLEKGRLTNTLLNRLGNILDDDSIVQLKLTLTNIFSQQHQWYITVLSFAFFLFVSTTLFAVIRNSLHDIWQLDYKAKPIVTGLRFRAESFLVILLAGILFLATVLVDSAISFFGTYVREIFPWLAWAGTGLANFILFITAVSLWFAAIFRYVSIGRPSWRLSLQSGLLTGILFWLGKNILRVALPMSNIGNIYGAAGSVIVIMLFVFYSSMIFYFGACYLKAWSTEHSKRITPRAGGFEYERKKIPTA